MLRMQVRYDEGRPRSWTWSKQAYERARTGQRPVTVHWHAGCPYRNAIAQENLESARLSLDELAARFERQDPAVQVTPCRRCTDEEVASIVALCRRVGYGKPTEVAPGVSVTLRDAGHIPGSASVLFEVRVGDKKRRVLFSGDVGNDLSPLFAGPQPAPDVDAVFIETTYGPTFRDPSVRDERAQFRRSVAEVVDRGGVAWIPVIRPGPHAEDPPRAASCPAGRDPLAAGADLLHLFHGPGDHGDLPATSPGRLVPRSAGGRSVRLVAGRAAQECRTAQESALSLGASYHQRDARQRLVADAPKPAGVREVDDDILGRRTKTPPARAAC